MTVLLLAEHDGSALNEATARAVTAAGEMGGPVTLLCAGAAGCDTVAREAAALSGVERVLVAESEAYGHGLAEALADLVVSLAGDHTHLVAPATANGKNVLPRVAGLLDVMILSDITRVVAPDTFERPIYAGNALQTVRSGDAKKVVTVRATAFDPAPAGNAAPVEVIQPGADPGLARHLGDESQTTDRPELTSARVVISGGRGMAASENFALLDPVADRLKAAVGASRAAVDAGYAPNDMQVGQTGKVVAPDLYIAVGISGAIQHLAGMKDSKVIVAINKDPDAPIFQVADYGLVADLFDAVPELARALEQLPA